MIQQKTLGYHNLRTTRPSFHVHTPLSTPPSQLVVATSQPKPPEGQMAAHVVTIGNFVPGQKPVTTPEIKLVFEYEKEEWEKTEKVIGCGFDPRQKKVFFTLDSELVRVINCKSEEFRTPLYPTLAANDDVSVLVNFGQSAFAYAPANGQRTPNPCFIGPPVNSPAAALGYEDSKELFSMGRMDSQWLNRCTTKGSHNNKTHYPVTEFNEESKDDLFEIILDSNGRSPNSVL
ncbi:C2H2-like zinc finger protein isoform 1 [Hibiscus syriacus]|uniref:C2H2-like zinc finger protein isoform 1 n=1 Tax=Hibiscus syriacus TaxID=106335 RepID=A0A6A2XAI6_HIBSY|nr:C2H2-like zinc finger protein isoform 1 [Hibiscus syriacus]